MSVWSDAVNKLGWQRPRDVDADALAQYLLSRNKGLLNMDALKVRPTEADAERAAAIFEQYGFVIIESALTAKRLKSLRSDVETAVTEIVATDPNRKGNRGSGRYSFGAASTTGSLAHLQGWAQLVELRTLAPALRRILGEGYTCRSVGGEFVLPGCVEYQPLHTDVDQNAKVEYQGRQVAIREAPCSVVAVNFLPQDFSQLNGPLRQILTDSRGQPTQTSKERVPTLQDETEASKLSTLLPCAAGAAVVRDLRAWHGGTPNVSQELRAIPNVEFYAEWHNPSTDAKYIKSMPQDVFDALSNEGKRLCAHIVAPRASLHLGWRPIDGGASLAGWITQNANYESTFEQQLDGHVLDAVGVVLQMGANFAAEGQRRIGYGVVDFVLKLRGAPERRLTGNRDGTAESYLPTGGRAIVGVDVYERYYYGIVDVTLLFADGTTARAFPDQELSDYRLGGKDKGGRRVTFRLPPGRTMLGLAAREQDNYGVIDLRLL